MALDAHMNMYAMHTGALHRSSFHAAGGIEAQISMHCMIPHGRSIRRTASPFAPIQTRIQKFASLGLSTPVVLPSLFCPIFSTHAPCSAGHILSCSKFSVTHHRHAGKRSQVGRATNATLPRSNDNFSLPLFFLPGGCTRRIFRKADLHK